MHNLFGDTNAVHVSLTDEGAYEITDLVHGDTVTEVLNYVQFHAPDLLQTFRRKVGQSLDLSRPEANAFIADYLAGLEGYTYLEGELPVESPPANGGSDGTAGAPNQPSLTDQPTPVPG